MEMGCDDPGRLMPAVIQALNRCAAGNTAFETGARDLSAASAVLLLLGPCPGGRGGGDEVGLILNKRSAQVRQPGDLCCPGGSVAPRVDLRVSRLLGLPLLPLGRWPYWRSWRRDRPLEARWLALHLATALRESFEEMRLNPLRIGFLGPLEPQRLLLFRRLIYPLAAWVPQQRKFRLNWEVERIVKIPLRVLLDPRHHVRYRLTLAAPSGSGGGQQTREHPAVRVEGVGGTELLWGVTYRIAMSFLKCAFDFTPPAADGLPLVRGRLEASYLEGRSEKREPGS
jgi:8-oxo-dGTP pyrophosphatase MutT (NUDIX family)